MPNNDKRRIVWVDDDLLSMDSQIIRLRGAGFDVTQITSVDEAYKHLSDRDFSADLVILDIMMATGETLVGEETNGGLKTGVAFVEKLSREGLLERLKIIFYTITDGDEMRQVGRKYGIQGYKKQNYPGKAIVELVRSVLEN